MVPKAQIKVLVGYRIFMRLMTQVLKHNHAFDRLLEPLFGSFLPIAVSLFAMKDGRALGQTTPFDRKESPVRYWLPAESYSACALCRVCQHACTVVQGVFF